MATYDLSALTNAFVGGAEVFGKEVLDWDIRELGIQVRTNVNTPQAMAKFEADGAPQPYRSQDDFNGMTVTDRVLTAYQSKYDQELDPEDFRNEYLATLPEMPFEAFSVEQAGKQFLDSLYSDTLWSGVRNGAGTAAADICDGWGTIIAAEILAGNLTNVVATNAITAANAVTEIEKVTNGVTAKMKKKGFNVYVSYTVFQHYRTHYRATYGFQFNPNQEGYYMIDGTKAKLIPCAFMGTSGRVVATYAGNLVFGTDLDRLSMYPTPHLNLLRNRILFPAGCQIRDLDVLFVNDQA